MICAFTVSAENGDKVVDNADLLTDSQEQELEDRLEELVDKYGCDAVIVTTDTIDGKTPMAYATTISTTTATESVQDTTEYCFF